MNMCTHNFRSGGISSKAAQDKKIWTRENDWNQQLTFSAGTGNTILEHMNKQEPWNIKEEKGYLSHFGQLEEIAKQTFSHVKSNKLFNGLPSF